MIVQGEDSGTNTCRLTIKTDHCADVVEDFLSLILQENEKENILQLGDNFLLAQKDELLPQDFASSGPWDGIDETHFSNFLIWCHLKTDIKI